MPAQTDLMLVTGASGYIASHCVQQLLDEGYKVRGTVRDIQNAVKIDPLKELDKSGRLRLVEADLQNETDWPNAISGCSFVFHVASPFPIVADADTIKTAIEGTMNVLRAAAKCPSVEKLILTSSCAAINEGHEDSERVFSEEDWTNLDNPSIDCYARSKTLAEKAAWDFWNGLNESSRFDFAVINPTLVVGPLLTNVQGSSVTIIRRFLNGEMPMVPHMQLGLVDVRDVARAHIMALQSDKANGQRFLLTYQPSYWFREIALLFAKEFRPQGYYVSTMEAPYPLLWIYSRFDREARSTLHRIGRKANFNNSKAKEYLGLELTCPDKSLIHMAYSMVERGILPKKTKFKKAHDSIKE